jgi:hypothetical protein
VLLALGERAVGDEHVAVLGPQHGRRARGVQAAAKDPGARLLEFGANRADLVHHLRQELRRREFPVGLVHADQVLLHRVFLPMIAGLLTCYTNAPGPDRHPLGVL